MNDLLLYFIGLIIILLVGTIFLFILKKRRKKLSSKIKEKIKQELEKIDKEIDFQKAIFAADKLLDFVLSAKGLTGSLGEKLKKGEKLFSNINEVWEAHKIRNRIAHELGAKISEPEFTRAIRSFKKAIKELLS
ncbi:MAG: hypothetical protein NTZ80_00530 [Patescibacteria group bacterium]|nr:hypothetical protein [Patescibacteria group bacterium]